ncbi:YybS family protein [Geobacter pickeringii]|uniref:Membrane protein n=1 Tax=Geobacter pickeringii TaxID=345632 RepID=A0A0B5BEY9_9BACT|nr:YybS family protein [Geobacter pickeringii]AJE02636.1 membrane protein [Geobacter pickeringii]
MSSDTKGTLLDILKGGVVSAILYAAFLSLPVFGLAAAVVTPFPVLYIGLKRGMGTGAGVALLAAALVTLVGGPLASVLYVVQAALLALVLAWGITRGYSASRSIATAVLVVLGVTAALAALYAVASGIDLHGKVVAAIRGSIAQSLALYEKKGIKGDELKPFRETLEQGGEMLSQLYPALLLICQSIVAGINVLLLRRFAGRLPESVRFAPFSSFRNPDYLVWAAIVAGFSLLVDNSVVTTAALNILTVAGFLYFMQGLAIAKHYFATYSVPALFRYLFYAMLVMQAYLVIAVALLGLFDLWADFRRPRKPKNL